MPSDKSNDEGRIPGGFRAVVEITDDTGIFADSAGPKEAPPKAEVSRKPPGANPPRTSSDKR